MLLRLNPGRGKNAAALAEERPVVVMSRGHSGTRVLGWTLVLLGVKMGTRPDFPAGDSQFRPLTDAIKKLARRHLHEPARATPSPRDVRLLQHRLVRYMEWLGDRSPFWGWKFPETYLIGNYVESCLPRARLIHMVRDGRDIAFKDHSTDRPRKLGKTLLEHIGALDQPVHLRAALSWQYQINRFEEFVRGWTLPVHTLTFEDLCREPVPTGKRLAEFLELPMPTACRTYLETKVDPRRVSQYREQNPALVNDVETAIGETLERWSYR